MILQPMTSKQKLAVLAASVMLCASHAAVAAPAEPLVVTPLSDPDPNYVPPPPEPKSARPARRSTEESTSLSAAFENLGRVTGQLAKMRQQQAGASPEALDAQARETLRKLQGDAGEPRQ